MTGSETWTVLQAPRAVAPRGYLPSSVTRDDAVEVGRLYYSAYDPGIACSSIEEAVEDTTFSFDGGYGEFSWSASRLARAAGTPVGAVLVVEQAAWPGAPDGPFIIELFVHRDHRRRGLAAWLVALATSQCFREGASRVSLQVRQDNVPAQRLYRTLGFAPA
ncbi:MAG TPA: GNAT family N-acetyltransferase [Motilibacteraceae bacterium]|nr:GNAT family N-acetyltransferase [Motilibacteraceae bacterium]